MPIIELEGCAEFDPRDNENELRLPLLLLAPLVESSSFVVEDVDDVELFNNEDVSLPPFAPPLSAASFCFRFVDLIDSSKNKRLNWPQYLGGAISQGLS